MQTELILLILFSALFVAGLLIVRWAHSQYEIDIIAPSDPPALIHPAPLISVIVPARNEERNIRRCIEGLLTQNYPKYELIVVDDRSTDATPQILAEMGAQNPQLKVLEGRDPPPGWAGKPHAIWQGVERTEGSWLCFVDADTFASPSLLASALYTARTEKAEMFSIFTDQILVTFWEKAIQPLVYTALSVGFPPSKVNDPQAPEAIANGQFILIQCDIYEAVGGHRAVKDQIAEDKALAELVKGRGFRLIVADGRAVASTRMYTSFSEIWEGWTKNIFLGMQGRLGLLLFGAVVGLVGALLLPTWLIGSSIWFLTTGGSYEGVVTLEALLLTLYLLYLRSLAARAFHISPLYALTFPLGALVFTAMMFASAFKVLSGQGVTWKGRKYRS